MRWDSKGMPWGSEIHVGEETQDVLFDQKRSI